MLRNKKIYLCAILSMLLMSGPAMAQTVVSSNDLFAVGTRINAQPSVKDQQAAFVAIVAAWPLEKVVALYEILKSMQTDAPKVYGPILVTASGVIAPPPANPNASLPNGEGVVKFGTDSRTVVVVPPADNNIGR